jgi:hypothetical protein
VTPSSKGSNGLQMTDNPRRLLAIENMRKVLTEVGWDPQPEEESGSFFIDFGPPGVPVSDAFAAITSDARRFVLYVNLGPAVPHELRDGAARFITYVNWRLIVGNFEMDYEDGDVRFRSSFDFAGVELSETLIRNAILAAMNAVEAYADLLIELLTGRKDAKQAIEEAEAKSN